MKKILPMLLALLLLAMPVLALADSTLRVQGAATLGISPDQAVLNIGYTEENPDSGAAQQRTAETIHAMIEAAQALGVAEEDIVTSYLNIYPVYSYADDTKTLRGYSVEHMLAVTVKNLDEVGKVLDALLAAGANQVSGITFLSSFENDVYLQALAQAIQNAAAKADAMAIASGVWLGSLEQINELTTSSVYARAAKEVMYDAYAGASLGGSLMTGELKITASVELVYGIR